MHIYNDLVVVPDCCSIHTLVRCLRIDDPQTRRRKSISVEITEDAPCNFSEIHPLSDQTRMIDQYSHSSLGLHYYIDSETA
jgi:hypothetical protein